MKNTHKGLKGCCCCSSDCFGCGGGGGGAGCWTCTTTGRWGCSGKTTWVLANDAAGGTLLPMLLKSSCRASFFAAGISIGVAVDTSAASDWFVFGGKFESPPPSPFSIIISPIWDFTFFIKNLYRTMKIYKNSPNSPNSNKNQQPFD